MTYTGNGRIQPQGERVRVRVGPELLGLVELDVLDAQNEAIEHVCRSWACGEEDLASVTARPAGMGGWVCEVQFVGA